MTTTSLPTLGGNPAQVALIQLVLGGSVVVCWFHYGRLIGFVQLKTPNTHSSGSVSIDIIIVGALDEGWGCPMD